MDELCETIEMNRKFIKMIEKKIKPEYEDLKRISQKFKMSLREIEKIVNQEILKIKNKP